MESTAGITPSEYEFVVKELLASELAKDFKGGRFEVFGSKHYLGKTTGHNHQIDASAEVHLAGTRVLILAECKKYESYVGVDDIMEFAFRIKDISAQKGILVTTVGFQTGTEKIARAEGIALVIVGNKFPTPLKLLTNWLVVVPHADVPEPTSWIARTIGMPRLWNNQAEPKRVAERYVHWMLGAKAEDTRNGWAVERAMACQFQNLLFEHSNPRPPFRILPLSFCFVGEGCQIVVDGADVFRLVLIDAALEQGPAFLEAWKALG
jgi:hypothetical protein